jgi:hypothetical protein
MSDDRALIRELVENWVVWRDAGAVIVLFRYQASLYSSACDPMFSLRTQA